jgi:hypothetical protein
MNFNDLIYELSQILKTDLKADLNQICPLVIDEEYHVQLEMDISGDSILIGCFVCELPPGKFRENILKDALKASHETKNEKSVFGYCEQVNQLTLFENIPNYDLNGEILYNEICDFVDRVKEWKSAIDSGKTSPAGAFKEPTQKEGRPLFGI